MTRTASLALALLLAAALPAADKPDRDAGAKKAITDAIAVLEARRGKEPDPWAKHRLAVAIERLERTRDLVVLTEDEQLAAFAADPAKQKGEKLSLHLMYVGKGPLQDRVGQEKVEFEGTHPDTGKPVRVLVDVPKVAFVAVPGDGRGAVLYVSLQCRDGKLDAGNVADAIMRK